jgi:hypothetical protein
MDEAALFDNPDALDAANGFTAYRDAVAGRDATSPLNAQKLSRKELAEAQLGRLRLLQRDGYVARIGANGMTVFRGWDA